MSVDPLPALLCYFNKWSYFSYKAPCWAKVAWYIIDSIALNSQIFSLFNYAFFLDLSAKQKIELLFKCTGNSNFVRRQKHGVLAIIKILNSFRCISFFGKIKRCFLVKWASIMENLFLALINKYILPRLVKIDQNNWEVDTRHS
jgi:hypothetical protein